MQDKPRADSGICIHLNQDRATPESFGTIELHGLSEQEMGQMRGETEAGAALRKRFVVTVAPEPGRAHFEIAPLFGRYEVEPRLVRFTPRFPLFPGQRYVARYGEAEAVLGLSATPRAATRVLVVYPTGEVVPENLLRWHILFSAPMREGEALRRVCLREEGDPPLPGVFLDSIEELWDANRKRLTLLLDPGRVKSGLIAHAQLGRALRAGGRYQLSVDRDYPDAHGSPLSSAWTKSFGVAAAARRALDGSKLRVLPPRAGGREPLTLCFPAPVDAVQATMFVRVRGPEGPLRGEVHVGETETLLRFVPSAPWCPVGYRIELDSRLEDCAGNNFAEPFDAAPQEHPPPSLIRLPFTPQE